MLASERRHRVIERLRRGGFVSTAELQTEFSVSGMTIRRDLIELEHRGMLRRVRGGATAAPTLDIGYGLRERMNRLEKKAIGHAAARLPEPDATVFIDTGTTAIEVARHLAARAPSAGSSARPLHIVTSSVKASAEFAGVPNVQVTQLGGEVYGQSFGVVGQQVIDLLAVTRVDWAFLGTCSFHPELGAGNDNHVEVPVKAAAMRSASRSVFLADGSKWGRAVVNQISPIDVPHTLVTTQAISEADRSTLHDRGWEVLIVKT